MQCGVGVGGVKDLLLVLSPNLLKSKISVMISYLHDFAGQIQLLPSVVDLKGAQELHPRLGQNFFIFMQFSGKIGQIVCWRPLPWEILDLPMPVHYVYQGLQKCWVCWKLNSCTAKVALNKSIRTCAPPPRDHVSPRLTPCWNIRNFGLMRQYQKFLTNASEWAEVVIASFSVKRL